MQFVDDALILSPTDVVNHLACEHLTQLNRLAARGVLEKLTDERVEVQLVKELGDDHESAYLASLQQQGLDVAQIDLTKRGREGLKLAHQATVEAMRSGADVIFQATFFDGRWRGHADFLFRTPHKQASELGDWVYEPYDTKLARTAKVAALVQLADYGAHLHAAQGVVPERVHIVLGDNTTATYRTADISGFHRRARQRLLASVEPASGGPVATYPDPVSHCALCEWNTRCEKQRDDDDHLSRVAGLGRQHVVSLSASGIQTAGSLVDATEDQRPQNMLAATFNRLREQARLQAEGTEATPTFALIDPALHPYGGFRRLPEPSAGDLFFDLEGDPYRGDDGRGIEYLWGITDLDDHFQSWWAHDSDAERVAFEACVDYFCECLERDPDLHIYHYAPYETVVLKRLAALHSSRERELDRLLRNEVFVDLYAVARHAVRISKPTFSIKDLEDFYMPGERSTEVQSGMASVVMYEQWLDSGEQRILDDIWAYNRDDCISTRRLRDWLESRRSEAGERWSPISRHVRTEEKPESPKVAERVERSERLRVKLLADEHREPVGDLARSQWLLGQLVDFHRREEKPAWWRHYAQRQMSAEQLWADSEALASLHYVGAAGEIARSVLHRYSFDPEQPHKLKPNISMMDHAPDEAGNHRLVSIHSVDAAAGELILKQGKKSTAPHPQSLIAGAPVPTGVLLDAIADIAETWVPGTGCEATFPAAHRLLMRDAPASLASVNRETPFDQVIRVADSLAGEVLSVQGPPGTGKTYTAAHMIGRLVASGKRVGVVANSHRVVENALEAVARYAPQVQILKVGGADPEIDGTEWRKDNAAGIEAFTNPESTAEVIGGTAWLFANTKMRNQLDVLVADEAGQFSLANTLAASTAASNLVLVGDPQQLDQPVQGIHRSGVAVSALSHMVGDDGRTISAQRGVFLDGTWRMSTPLCSFVSDSFYEGRLEVATAAPQRSIDGVETGLHWVPVIHAGNRGRSAEEADVVASLAEDILGRTLGETGSSPRPMRESDLMCITPFNAQVQAIREALIDRGLDAIPVGTVDLFQGREAPVVLYSMAASHPANAPRGINFLYSTHRFNVALSRAQVAAYVVASPRLLDAHCHRPNQLPMVGALINFVDRAHHTVELPTPRAVVQQ